MSGIPRIAAGPGPAVVDYGDACYAATARLAQIERRFIERLSNPFVAFDLPVGDMPCAGEGLSAPRASWPQLIADPDLAHALPLEAPSIAAQEVVLPGARGRPEMLLAGGMTVIRNPDSFEDLCDMLGMSNHGAQPPYGLFRDSRDVSKYLDSLVGDTALAPLGRKKKKGAVGELILVSELVRELKNEECCLIHSVDVPFREQDGRESFRRPDHILLHPRIVASLETKNQRPHAWDHVKGARIDSALSEVGEAASAIEETLRRETGEDDVEVVPIVCDTGRSMRPPGLEINTSVTEPVYEEIPWDADADPTIRSPLLGRHGRRKVHYTDNGVWIARFIVASSRPAYAPEQIERFRDILLALKRRSY
ncbi:MAG: NERD domain-containing protein [Proteobacteria bacterium]|nr:NERD domain-containing protein [Pseudomonadota bacterium]